MIIRYCISVLILVFFIGNISCTAIPERKNNTSPGITVSVESGQGKDKSRSGDSSLEDISSINKKAEGEEKTSPGIMDSIKSFLFKLKIPF